MLDIEKIRGDYPILNRTVAGCPLVYLDNAATSQSPKCVVEGIEEMYYRMRANVHRGVHTLSQEATDMVEQTRRMVCEHIGAESVEEIVFTRGTTEAINLVAGSFGEMLKEGDEVIVTEMEHHANIVPWQMLRSRRGIQLRVLPITDSGELCIEQLEGMINSRTRLVSVCHVSNVLGTVNPVKEVVEIAHCHGVRVLIDGAQAVAHTKVNVKDLDCDFYAFSSHKMYGPTGVGVLYGKRELLEAMPPYQGGGEMIGTVSFEHTTWADLPFKFEAGTPDYVNISALSRAIDYVNGLGLENISAHEHELLEAATAGLLTIPGMRLFGTAPGKDAVVSFLIGDVSSYDVGLVLDKLGVAVRTGHHCAQPLMHRMGVEGTVRASFAVYNTMAEVERFVESTRRVARMFGYK